MKLSEVKQFIADVKLIKHRKGHNWKDVANIIGVNKQVLESFISGLDKILPKLKKQYVDKNKHLLK